MALPLLVLLVGPGCGARSLAGSGEGPSTPTPVPSSLSEQVTCVFVGATTTHRCSTNKGSCSAVGQCNVQVQGSQSGELLLWRSSCAIDEPVVTVIDGKDETVYFECEADDPPEPIPDPPEPIPDPPEPVAEESVTCVFDGSIMLQECVSNIGIGCYGVQNCTVAITGELGRKLSWKSTCDGMGYTVIDGVDEKVQFACNDDQPMPNEVTDQVTCVFSGSTTVQECYSGDGIKAGCSGVQSCTLSVTASPGQTLSWKSTCGGYAYTVMDGNPDKALFKCN